MSEVVRCGRVEDIKASNSDVVVRLGFVSGTPSFALVC